MSWFSKIVWLLDPQCGATIHRVCVWPTHTVYECLGEPEHSMFWFFHSIPGNHTQFVLNQYPGRARTQRVLVPPGNHTHCVLEAPERIHEARGSWEEERGVKEVP